MSNELAEGIWSCVVLSAEDKEVLDQAGNATEVTRILVTVRLEDGPSKGRVCTYEDEVNAKSYPYIERSLKNVGWTGASFSTVKADAAKWIEKTGGKSTAEIVHIPVKRGKKFDKWMADGQKGSPPVWDKVKSIGSRQSMLAEPSPKARAAADDFIRMANGGSAPDDAGPLDDSPFATISRIGLGEIAKVLK